MRRREDDEGRACPAFKEVEVASVEEVWACIAHHIAAVGCILGLGEERIAKDHRLRLDSTGVLPLQSIPQPPPADGYEFGPSAVSHLHDAIRCESTGAGSTVEVRHRLADLVMECN